MPITSRQTGSLAAENWKKVYQTFREADFTSYDFESLRKTMIDYIKINYAEEFNDFTESSEFIALVDLIAFLGQSLAFRADLNARENFIDTAERRDSILKLARLISYNPKRNVPASGYLKVDSISTTETIFDSDGFDLSNRIILWNDLSNENWLEQFVSVLNSCLLSQQNFGRPANSQIINNVRTEEYAINLIDNVLPIFKFESSVNGLNASFEVVSASSAGKNFVYEVPPDINKPFNILYRNDGNGNASNNTGFFFYFKQGELGNFDFTVDLSVPNKVINVDITDINNNDVWLYSLDTQGFVDELWTQVPTTNGVNVIYNTRKEKNLYQVTSRANDQISLVFGDGTFANIPQGNFRLYYRLSNGFSYKIIPDELQGILVTFDYVSRNNRVETITFRASLRYTVANASTRETADDIKQRAPQQYYTQNRMITGEDYNIFPYTTFSDIRKVKSINRISSGLSRYLDTLDSTGKYSSTNFFAEDGVLYSQRGTNSVTATFKSDIEIRKFVRNTLIPNVIDDDNTRHLYYEQVNSLLPYAPVLDDKDLLSGEFYQIVSVGSTDFTKYGAVSNTVGQVFYAYNAGNATKTLIVGNIGTQSYTIDGNISLPNPDIKLKVGDTLVLNVRTPGNPLHIKITKSVGLLGNVTTGTIFNNGTDNGTITWSTVGVTAATYYYVNRNNLTMSGNIIVENFGTGTARTSIKWNQGSVGNGASTGYFSYNRKPIAIGSSVQGNNNYINTGALIKFIPEIGYRFNSNYNMVPGTVLRTGDSSEKYAAIGQIFGNGTNNNLGLFANSSGPVTINLPIPTGARIESIISTYKNNLRDSIVNEIVNLVLAKENFYLNYSVEQQNWIIVNEIEATGSGNWLVGFVYNSQFSSYTITNKYLRYVFHSPRECNFFFDKSLQTYDLVNNRFIVDSVKLLKTNSSPDLANIPLNVDLEWFVSSEIKRSDGYVENKSVYLTYSDTNQDGVPDEPAIFDKVVLGGPYRASNSSLTAQTYAVTVNYKFKKEVGRYPTITELDYYITNLLNNNFNIDTIDATFRALPESELFRSGVITSRELIYFQLVQTDYGSDYRLMSNDKIISYYNKRSDILPEIKNFNVGQLFYCRQDNQFYRSIVNKFGNKTVSDGLNLSNSTALPNYIAYVGRQDLFYQYRHNSPNSNRIDPNVSNIIDIYVLTSEYETEYRLWLADTTGRITEPSPPTDLELYTRYSELQNYKSISDTIVLQSAKYKPLFGNKADQQYQSVFKVVKNPNLSITDADIKSSLISAVNEYFSSNNWDFGDTFYFSELSAYLHKQLVPNIASVVIVSRNQSRSLGNMYQINAEPYEIIISAATVDDVEIVTAITALDLQPTLT